MATTSGRVPDRRGIGPLLNGHRDVLGHRDSEPLRVIGRPARGGYLNHPNVVEGTLFRIEVGVCPVGHQHGVADGVGVTRVVNVDGGADRRFAATVGANLAAVGNRYVIDALVPLSVAVDPPLDDLNTIEAS